jgi:hypothetical protein
MPDLLPASPLVGILICLVMFLACRWLGTRIRSRKDR